MSVLTTQKPSIGAIALALLMSLFRTLQEMLNNANAV
jgi:hypothetical protein